MIVFSFQSQEVINELLSKGEYYCDSKLSREQRDYSEDVTQLGGFNPIWCYAPVNSDMFSLSDFADGTKLERFRCEMSLDQKDGLSKFFMLELDIDTNDLYSGKTHNAYLGAKVFSKLKLENLRAIYKVNPTSHFFYKSVELITCYAENPFFGKEFCPTKRIVRDDVAYSLELNPIVGKEYYFFLEYKTLTPCKLVSFNVEESEYIVKYGHKKLVAESIYRKEE